MRESVHIRDILFDSIRRDKPQRFVTAYVLGRLGGTDEGGLGRLGVGGKLGRFGTGGFEGPLAMRTAV